MFPQKVIQKLKEKAPINTNPFSVLHDFITKVNASDFGEANFTMEKGAVRVDMTLKIEVSNGTVETLLGRLAELFGSIGLTMEGVKIGE